MAAIKGKAILIKKKKNSVPNVRWTLNKSDWTNVKGKLVKKEFFC